MELIILITCAMVVAVGNVGGQVVAPFQFPQAGAAGGTSGRTQFPPDIFQNCINQAGIPMSVALGNYFLLPEMCSGDFFQYCRTQLPVALTQSMQLFPNQQNYIMNHLLMWVNGGATYLCTVGQNVLAGLMQNGGRDCIQTTAAAKLGNCQQSLYYLNSGLQYDNEFCGHLDTTLQCFLDAVNMCPNNPLRDFLWDFFKSVVNGSQCAAVSRFTNSASLASISSYLMLVSLGLLALLRLASS